MWDQINDSAPENFLNDVLENEVNEIVEDLIEMDKRCFMPYNRLDIRCNRREIDFEKVDYLLDNSEFCVDSVTGTSQWQAPLDRAIDITITVKDEYFPIIITHYALKSANDAPERDPKRW